ncbi:MAG TPA: type II toxin-antitoxin system VapC family toxin [Candidatus Nanoarchaeia archaeon]|nr:type II toxin-antitoxin system VapC family toxin [Candidatus Nanoarchaeia archaeon]
MEKGDKVYVDANVFIFAAISEEELGQKAIRVLDKIKERKINSYTSVLTFDEVFWKVKKMRNKEFALLITEAMLSLPNLTFLDTTYETVSAAHSLLERHDELGPRDAIHAATALAHGIRSVMSTDPDFDNLHGIKRISL